MSNLFWRMVFILCFSFFFFFSCCENIALARLGVILRISSGFDYEYVSFIAEDELLHKITSWV